MGGLARCKCFWDVRLRVPDTIGSVNCRRRPNLGMAVVSWWAAFAPPDGSGRCRSSQRPPDFEA